MLGRLYAISSTRLPGVAVPRTVASSCEVIVVGDTATEAWRVLDGVGEGLIDIVAVALGLLLGVGLALPVRPPVTVKQPVQAVPATPSVVVGVTSRAPFAAVAAIETVASTRVGLTKRTAVVVTSAPKEMRTPREKPLPMTWTVWLAPAAPVTGATAVTADLRRLQDVEAAGAGVLAGVALREDRLVGAEPGRGVAQVVVRGHRRAVRGEADVGADDRQVAPGRAAGLADEGQAGRPALEAGALEGQGEGR